MKKKREPLSNDAEAEEVAATADLTEYELSVARTVRFEFEAKSAKISTRLPESLLRAVKALAANHGAPYQRFIRETLERALTK